MKHILVLSGVLLFAFNLQAKRFRIPVCFPCEKIATVQDLPDEENLKEAGSYLNLGYMYKEYGILFIPAWNEKGRYVLTNEDESVYYDLKEEELNELAKKYNVELSSNPLSFWKKIGGKIIYIILIALIVYGYFSKDEEEEVKNVVEED